MARLSEDLPKIASSLPDKYVQCKLRDVRTALSRDAYVLGRVLADVGKPLSDITLIDYGGGPGFHSLLAKRLRVGTVIYNDILPGYCRLAQQVAASLGCEADYYVEGDIDALVQFCAGSQIRADAITSSDVLEHIYDIDDFLRKLHALSHEGTVTMHATGSNMFWYPSTESVSRLHVEVETKSAEEIDPQTPYRQQRMTIIREHAANISDEVAEQLCSNTRGLIKRDIVEAVDRYLRTGRLPNPIEHPTNTCNPHTGYWAERSMNPYYLRETLQFNGFESSVVPGRWEKGNSVAANVIRGFLNLLALMCGTHTGLHLCYYFSIYARFNGSFSSEDHREHLYRHRRSVVVWPIAAAYRVLSLARSSKGNRDWWRL